MSARRGVTILLLASAPAWSQPIYRCGDTYGPQPCAEGRAIDAADPRTREQQAQTENAARGDARLAESLRHERLRQASRLDAEKKSLQRPIRTGAEPVATSWDELDLDRELDAPRKPPVFVARVPGKKNTPAGKPPRRSAAAKAASAKD